MAHAILPAIAALRDSVEDLAQTEDKLKDDMYLLLWLKLKKMSVTKAEEAIRETFKWYSERKPEAQMSLVPQSLIDYLPITVDGVGHDGMPVCYVRAEKIDVFHLLQHYNRDDITRYGLWITIMAERAGLHLMHKKYESEGPDALETMRPFTTIVDCYGYSLKHFPPIKAFQIFIEMALEAVKFPATTRTAYLIGANKVFWSILRPVSPILKRLGVVLKVYGTNEDDWKSDVYQVISPEALEVLRKRVGVNVKN